MYKSVTLLARIRDDRADPDTEPVPYTYRGAMSIFGCLTTQLGEGLGLCYVCNVVRDWRYITNPDQGRSGY